ncbi:MAG TPA: nucleotide exchange factor GrpE [Steroidobacteraceae bacterium]|jgi:molecular chaperone GrpE|nr:nucleotide exchange factor GrpE [Steroidobacteraceae bacterium]
MSNRAHKDAERGAPDTQREFDPEATAVLTDSAGQANAGELAKALAAAEAKAQENWNNYLRAAAELDNVRKRGARDLENALRYGLEKFAADMLEVRDSLELGLEAGETADARSLLAGKEATLRLLSKAFDKYGVVEINPVGAPFDPQLHEAMAMQDSATAEPNTVLQVVQKGYQLNGRLLRPARVIVARAPSA